MDGIFAKPHVSRIPCGSKYHLLVDAIFHGKLKNVATKWRISSQCNRTVREGESKLVVGTFKEMFEWVSSDIKTRNGHPFGCIPRYSEGTTSLYADYKYFHDIFRGYISIDDEEEATQTPQVDNVLVCRDSKLLLATADSTGPCAQVFDWADFGIPHVNAATSTLWLGTAGCHTPLHYDSYGNNVILQLHGVKRWCIWLPTDRNAAILEPSRIPYEESSIYADRACFDPLQSTDMSRLPPDWTITLHAGEVLHLPKHCWHFVYTVSPTQRHTHTVSLVCLWGVGYC